MFVASLKLLDRNVRHQSYIYNSQLYKNATDTGINYPLQ